MPTVNNKSELQQIQHNPSGSNTNLHYQVIRVIFSTCESFSAIASWCDRHLSH
ncbi:hypothetical protein WN943_014733 [Citrus x changshan-huyou]